MEPVLHDFPLRDLVEHEPDAGGIDGGGSCGGARVNGPVQHSAQYSASRAMLEPSTLVARRLMAMVISPVWSGPGSGLDSGRGRHRRQRRPIARVRGTST